LLVVDGRLCKTGFQSAYKGAKQFGVFTLYSCQKANISPTTVLSMCQCSCKNKSRVDSTLINVVFSLNVIVAYRGISI